MHDKQSDAEQLDVTLLFLSRTQTHPNDPWHFQQFISVQVAQCVNDCPETPEILLETLGATCKLYHASTITLCFNALRKTLVPF